VRIPILAVSRLWWTYFPTENAYFGRFEVAFDRPEFDKTQQCLFSYIFMCY